MTYPTAISRPDATHLYSFSIYDNGFEANNKIHLDFYTVDGAKKMWDIIEADYKNHNGFYCSKANLDNNYLDDVNSKRDIS